MKLLKANFNILTQEPGFDGLLRHIELCGRTAYKSEDLITADSAPKFVNMLKTRGHGAVLEHGTVYLYVKNIGRHDLQYNRYMNERHSVMRQASLPIVEDNEVKCDFAITTNYRVLVENNWLDDLHYQCECTYAHEKRITVKFVCDRGVSHEFVRHRVFSFVQESTRYCNYSKDKFKGQVTYIIPPWTNLVEGSEYDMELIQDFDIRESEGLNDEDAAFIANLSTAEAYYLWFLDKGWTPQQARAVLPNALKTELIMTGFFKDWVGGEHNLGEGLKIKYGFFPLRCDAAAHPQARELAVPLKEEFAKLGLFL